MTMSKAGLPFSASKLAVFLSARVKALSSIKTEKEISDAIGYNNPKMIRMLMHGESRLPLDKVMALAEAIDVDPGWLARMTAETYSPELLVLVDKLLVSGTPTDNEGAILAIVRSASKYRDPKLDPALTEHLSGLFDVKAEPVVGSTLS